MKFRSDSTNMSLIISSYGTLHRHMVHFIVIWHISSVEFQIKVTLFYSFVPSVPKTGTLKLAKIAKKLRH